MWRIALVLGAALLTGCPPVGCPPGYTPICQSGSIHGTRCSCEPPR